MFFDKLLELLFIRMVRDLCEELFVFFGRHLVGLSKLVKMRELKVKLGHPDRIELDSLVQRIGTQSSLL